MAKGSKPKDEELDAVFMGMSGPAEGEDMDEDAESEEALDAAIDEAFSSDDPVTRREAFKNAIRLCKEGY